MEPFRNPTEPKLEEDGFTPHYQPSESIWVERRLAFESHSEAGLTFPDLRHRIQAECIFMEIEGKGLIPGWVRIHQSLVSSLANPLPMQFGQVDRGASRRSITRMIEDSPPATRKVVPRLGGRALANRKDSISLVQTENDIAGKTVVVFAVYAHTPNAEHSVRRR